MRSNLQTLRIGQEEALPFSKQPCCVLLQERPEVLTPDTASDPLCTRAQRRLNIEYNIWHLLRPRHAGVACDEFDPLPDEQSEIIVDAFLSRATDAHRQRIRDMIFIVRMHNVAWGLPYLLLGTEEHGWEGFTFLGFATELIEHLLHSTEWERLTSVSGKRYPPRRLWATAEG